MKAGEKYPVAFRVGALTVYGGGHVVSVTYNADTKPSFAQIWARVLDRFHALGYDGPLEVDETSTGMHLVAKDKRAAGRPRFQTFLAPKPELTYYSGEEPLRNAGGRAYKGVGHG